MKCFCFFVIFTMSFIGSPVFSVVSKTCENFEIELSGDDKHVELGRALYKELYEELEELSLTTEKIDICSFKCLPQDENSVQCHMHLRLEYTYIPFLGEYQGTIYCQESYSFDGLSDYEIFDEECDLTDFPHVLE